MAHHCRFARPVLDLSRTSKMYGVGLGLHLLGSFVDHQGFDGVILGSPDAGYHFEFTYCRRHPVAPRPTPEDMVVLYIPNAAEWSETCARMMAAGFARRPAFNPYWDRCGATFEDPDGYLTVLQNESWASPART